MTYRGHYVEYLGNGCTEASATETGYVCINPAHLAGQFFRDRVPVRTPMPVPQHTRSKDGAVSSTFEHYCSDEAFPTCVVPFGRWSAADFKNPDWPRTLPSAFNPLYVLEREVWPENVDLFYAAWWEYNRTQPKPTERLWSPPPSAIGVDAHTLVHDMCNRLGADPLVVKRRIAQLMMQKRNVKKYSKSCVDGNAKKKNLFKAKEKENKSGGQAEKKEKKVRKRKQPARSSSEEEEEDSASDTGSESDQSDSDDAISSSEEEWEIEANLEEAVALSDEVCRSMQATIASKSGRIRHKPDRFGGFVDQMRLQASQLIQKAARDLKVIPLVEEEDESDGSSESDPEVDVAIEITQESKGIGMYKGQRMFYTRFAVSVEQTWEPESRFVEGVLGDFDNSVLQSWEAKQAAAKAAKGAPIRKKRRRRK
jgi:hypothetical protein